MSNKFEDVSKLYAEDIIDIKRNLMPTAAQMRLR